ncbi:uncharacterized protein LOC122507199 isoform X2 [Leptopilina heterotoma]|uniref:uncharacterized protein LOC122507199 isoform X2 n=1 Tax=Leptopilina heterotoma TaxID=63436 RepID=UPI001CA8A54E|nr:uncharacterized protein LOC122507199 isoform X2 [Leptopilina heterotoma]
MVGKWTLQLLGTVLMFIVGIFNFYKEEIPLTENSCLKEITLMNDRINMDFREQLKITTQYFEKLLNSYKCNKSNSPTVSVNYNYRKILILACESAEDIYLYNRLYNYTSDYLIPSRIKTIKNAIPFACGKQPERLKEIYESIYQFLNLYYTNFPNERNGIEYNTCYVVSLLEFATLEELINSNDIKLSRNLEIAKKCVPLKLHKENSTAKYFSKKMSNNSKSVNYQLHRKDKTFKNHLKLVTKFFKSILKHCEFTMIHLNSM